MPLCIRHAQGMGLSHTAVRLVEGFWLRGVLTRARACARVLGRARALVHSPQCTWGAGLVQSELKPNEPNPVYNFPPNRKERKTCDINVV